MGWSEYYRLPNIDCFGQNSAAYYFSIARLNMAYPGIIDPETPQTFVLGGFTHTNSTISDFDILCHYLHPNPQAIYLDMNRLPLEHVSCHEQKLQTNLESLPFAPNSIDFLFLDFTQMFMTTNQLRHFFELLPQQLKPNGLLLMSVTNPTLPHSISNILDRHTNRVPTYYHSVKEIVSLSPLPLVYGGNNDTTDILVFGHPQSILPPHEGDYYDLSTDNIIDSWILLHSQSVS